MYVFIDFFLHQLPVDMQLLHKLIKLINDFFYCNLKNYLIQILMFFVNSLGGMLMCIGCGDGTVRVFDRRLSHNESKVMTFREHTSWVISANFTDEKHIISGRYFKGCLFISNMKNIINLVS